MATEEENTKKDYEVGYGKPPKNGQFKPGQSGNRRGSSAKARSRAAKKPSFGKLLSDGMQQPVEIEEDGKKVFITRLHYAIRQRVAGAAKGKIGPLKELLKLLDMPEHGPLAPGKQLVFTLDEARALGRLDDVLYRSNTVLVREPKPSARGETPKRRPRKEKPSLPRLSARELIEIELERQTKVTDAATGTTKRMTMREIIAEQLMRQFMAGKAGAADLINKLNKAGGIDKAELQIVYIGIPWDYELPPRLARVYGTAVREQPADGMPG